MRGSSTEDPRAKQFRWVAKKEDWTFAVHMLDVCCCGDFVKPDLTARNGSLGEITC